MGAREGGLGWAGRRVRGEGVLRCLKLPQNGNTKRQSLTSAAAWSSWPDQICLRGTGREGGRLAIRHTQPGASCSARSGRPRRGGRQRVHAARAAAAASARAARARAPGSSHCVKWPLSCCSCGSLRPRARSSAWQLARDSRGTSHLLQGRTGGGSGGASGPPRWMVGGCVPVSWSFTHTWRSRQAGAARAAATGAAGAAQGAALRERAACLDGERSQVRRRPEVGGHAARRPSLRGGAAGGGLCCAARAERAARGGAAARARLAAHGEGAAPPYTPPALRKRPFERWVLQKAMPLLRRRTERRPRA